MTSVDQMQLCRDALQSAIAVEKTEIKHETLRVIIERCRKKDSQGIPEHVAEISSQLIELLAGDGLHLENQMLCSTAFSVAVTTCHDEERSNNVLRECLSTDDSGKLDVELEEGKRLRLTVKRVDMFRLCLCHGMLQSRSAAILQSQQDDGTYEEIVSNQTADGSNGDDCRPTLAQVMLGVVVDCCSRYSHLTHLAFRVLAAWIEKVDRVDSARNEVYDKVFHVAFTNWDSPMNGVREQNARILELLIDIHPKRLHKLLDEVLQHQPWTIKSKYLVLAVLLPKYGVAKALAECGDLPTGLVSSLHQSHLVSAGCDVYRVCVLQLDEEEWTAYFLTPIMRILALEDANTSADVCNLFNYWMPVTLKRFPSLADTLLSRLSTANEAAILHLLKLSQAHHSDIAKDVRLRSGETLPISDLVARGIRHSDDTIRRLAFAVVCLSSKTTTTPSADEFRLVLDFLTENINVDSAPFRQSVYNSCTTLMRRISGSSVHELRKMSIRDKNKVYNENRAVGNKNSLKECCDITKVDSDTRSALKSTNKEIYPGASVQRSVIYTDSNDKASHCHDHSELERTVCFLEWFHSFLLNNLEPGTNYQRKILSLRLYQLVLRTFVKVGSLKSRGSRVGDLVECANRLDKWHFESRRSRHVLVSCILNPTEDIREFAGAILLEYFCGNNFTCVAGGDETLGKVSGGDRAIGSDRREFAAPNGFGDEPDLTNNSRAKDIPAPTGFGDKPDVMNRSAAKDIASPTDFRDKPDVTKSSEPNEISALLSRGLGLCGSSKFYETESGALLLKLVAAWIYRKQRTVVGADCPPLSNHATLTSLLLERARLQWGTMRSELFAAVSSGCPVHGIITALTRVAIEADGPEYHIVTWEDKQAIVSLAEEITEHLLGVLSSKSDGITEFAPSFAEMGEAIDSATQQESSDVHLSAAHQLLLNCVWLNLKACCQLASAMGSCNPGIDVATLRRCTRLITNVLTRCRHKGAIESAGVALGRLVQVASASENRALPAEVLGQFLDSQTGGASVTRRSAGLAILVHRIVASDTQPGKPLVAVAMTRLISVASAPIGQSDAELSDLPQAQALHFLRTLVQDASLRQNVAPFMSRAAMLCFENFASPIWTIRNASLQLFGAVASKLVGQKKSHDDDVVGTLEELTAHFPTLLRFLLSRLRDAAVSPDLHPTLVPNLSLLSKMSLNHPYLSSEHVSDVGTPDGPYASGSMCEGRDLIASLLRSLFHLLSSHVQAVRKLAAKAIANFTPFPRIERRITSLISMLSNVDATNSDGCLFISGPIGENQLNGLLLTLQYLADRFLKESVSMSRYSGSIENIGVALSDLRKLRFKSHCNFALVLQIMNFTGYTSDVYSYGYCESILSMIAEQAGNSDGTVKIGFYQWGSVEIELIVRHCPDEELFDCFIKVLEQPKNYSFDISRVVKNRLSQDTFPVEVKLHILSRSFSLLSAEQVRLRPLPLIEIMLLLSSQNLSLTLPLESLDLFYNRYVRHAGYGWKCSAVGLSVVSNLLGSLIESTDFSPTDDVLAFLMDITNCITIQSCPWSSDEDQRLNAAVSLSFLSRCLLGMLERNVTSPSPLWRSILKTVFNSCVMLLQDENCEVRGEAASFASQILEDVAKVFGVKIRRYKYDHDSLCRSPCCLLNLSSLQNRTAGAVLNPYHCLQSLFAPDCLAFWFGEYHAVFYLWIQLDFAKSLDEVASKKGKAIVSPFDHGTSNVYAENVKIVEWSLRTLKELLTSVGEDTRLMFVDDVNQNRSSLDRAWTSLSEMASTNVSAVDPDCVYLLAKKLSSQLEVFEMMCGDFAPPSWTDRLQEFLYHYGLVL